MLKPTRALITFALLIGVATGCDFLGGSNAATDPPPKEALGILDDEYYKPLDAPDTVQVNTEFDVTITTFGPSSCYSAAREEVERATMRVEITVYDQYETGNVACAAVIAPLSRTVSMAFENTGEATIELNGRRPGPVDDPEPTTLTHTVIVE
jgi:hypothetical protein